MYNAVADMFSFSGNYIANTTECGFHSICASQELEQFGGSNIIMLAVSSSFRRSRIFLDVLQCIRTEYVALVMYAALVFPY